MMRRRFADRCLLRLGRAEHGSAAVEFALITPVFMMLLMGSLDLAHQIYLRSVLSGATQVAARVSGLEDGSTTTADAAIQRIIAPVAPGAQVSISRQNYVSYSAVDVWESLKVEQKVGSMVAKSAGKMGRILATMWECLWGWLVDWLGYWLVNWLGCWLVCWWAVISMVPP